MSIASEITRLQNAKASIKTSIENKGVTVPSATTLDGYSTLIDSIPTSSSIVNGIIEQYKASTSTIDANTFVEFVNVILGTDTTLVESTSSYEYANAVLIDDNKVFIAHSSDSTNNYLNGIVCTISETTITPGTDTTLVSAVNSYEYASAVKLETNKVFIAHRNGGSSSNTYLNGIVCTISGTTITAGTDTTLVSNNNSYYYANAVLIDDNKVFVAHRKGGSSTSNYLNGMVCTISGTTITKGTDTTLVSTAYSYEFASVVKLETNKVFIAHKSDGSNKRLNGIVCTISGTAITAGTDTNLVFSNTSSTNANAVLIDTNKVFIAHRKNETETYLNGIVCTISGTTITKGTDTILVSVDSSGQDIDVVKLETNKVFIAHRNGGSSSNTYLNGIVCTISGTTITAGTDTTLVSNNNSSDYASAVLINATDIFIAHRSDNANAYLNGLIVDNSPAIIESVSKIEGLTKTECTTSTAGDVWVLDV